MELEIILFINICNKLIISENVIYRTGFFPGGPAFKMITFSVKILGRLLTSDVN